MITWYTQPRKSFASFYRYDEHTRELVRIRLELQRPICSDKGATVAGYFPNRYVGFAKYEEFDTRRLDEFKISEGKIVHGVKGPMSDTPKPGLFIYDFTSEGGDVPESLIHIGSAVVDGRKARLPDGIEEDDLIAVADFCLTHKKSVKFTERDASEEDLSKAIKRFLDCLKIVDMDGRTEDRGGEKDGFGDAMPDTTPSRKRSRRRCTIL